MEKLLFIVDDDRVQNEIHSILLKKVAHEVRIMCFQSSKLAFESMDQGNIPDIIFLDLHIPGEGPSSFLDEHKLRNLSSDIYLMSSVAYIEDSNIISAYPSVKDFITKPLLDYKLKAVVGQYA